MLEYSTDFLRKMGDSSRRSAEVIVPIIREFINPRSVLDLGCGTGDWLRRFRETGTQEVMGVDGPWIDRNVLAIKRDEFHAHDLKEPWTPPRTFDLAMNLEVVVHLPEKAMDPLVRALTAAAPVVILSSPIPNQVSVGTGPWFGAWPDYWAKLFGRYGYVPIDCVRSRIWDEPDVAWWFAQNLIFYVRKDKLPDYPALEKAYRERPGIPVRLVHPAHFAESQRRKAIAGALSFRELVAAFPRALSAAIKRRLTGDNLGPSAKRA